MTGFTVYPAMDLRYGKVIRLRQGKAEQQTVYSHDPITVAQKWIDQGAKWLHVVNLDDAFHDKTQENNEKIADIMRLGSGILKVQLGGGIRSISLVEEAFSLGVSRVILGTAVIENPQFGIDLLNRFGGEKVVFALDAVENELLTRGWQSHSGVSMDTFAKTLVDAGAQTLIYTNVHKDGMQTGVDWKNAKSLADQTGLSVIASGGVAWLDDIAMVKSVGLDGVIVGRALYEGNFTLTEALNVS